MSSTATEGHVRTALSSPASVPILSDSKTPKSSGQPGCNKEELSDRLIHRAETQGSSQPEPTKQTRQENMCFPKHTTEAITSDKWLFSDQSEEGFQSRSSHHSTPKQRHARNNARSDVRGRSAENGRVSTCFSDDDEREDELKLKDVYTYSSQPRSAPRGRLHNASSQGIMWTVEMKGDEEQDIADEREAPMEEDFHGTYSSEEEDSLNGMTKLPLETLTSTEVSAVEHTLGPLEARSASVERPSWATPALPKMDSQQFPSSFTPVQSRSPTMLDVPDAEINLTKGKDAQPRTMVKTSLKEIPKEDPRLTTETCEYDWLKYQPKDMSESDEARMLASLRRQQLEEMEDDGKTNHLNAVQLGDCAYGDDSISTSSDDTSIWIAQHTGLPANQGHHYQDEMLLTLSQKKMNPLFLSNPRDWGDIFSPPIILPSEQMKDQRNIISPRQPSALQDLTNDTGNVMEDQDEVLDLLYDPCLNCYFDPKTGKYYELA
ncbi:protein CFAP20DC-like [Leucoraja erinacea]|uniref:protein CFAP20DC-like n=1 Tax=Leucoraja erinaceus TaxID=7782 RepID=UPI0024566CD5|nr:protein CFAP20DC-like [Leucoraja erinacea]